MTKPTSPREKAKQALRSHLEQFEKDADTRYQNLGTLAKKSHTQTLTHLKKLVSRINNEFLRPRKEGSGSPNSGQFPKKKDTPENISKTLLNTLDNTPSES